MEAIRLPFLRNGFFYLKITYKLPNHDILREKIMLVCSCKQKKRKLNEKHGGDYDEKEK